MKKRYLAAAVTLMLGAGGVQAASVESQFFPGELNQLSDNDAESQNVDLNGDGFLWVGDTLRATGTIETIEDKTGGGGTNNLGANDANLDFISEIEVLSAAVTTDLDNSCGGDPTCGGGTLLTGDELADYVFGPNAAFTTELSLNANTVIALYEGTVAYDRTGTIANAESTVLEGGAADLLFELGFGLDADEVWEAFGAPTNLDVFALTPDGTPIGTYQVQLSFLANNTSLEFEQVSAGCNSIFAPTFPCAGDGLIDVNGGGSLLGVQGATTSYAAFSNVDFTVFVVPEPASIALLSMGFLGIGAAAARRRRNKS